MNCGGEKSEPRLKFPHLSLCAHLLGVIFTVLDPYTVALHCQMGVRDGCVCISVKIYLFNTSTQVDSLIVTVH